MMRIVFKGTRKRDFTTRGLVTGYPYYVQPGVSFTIDDEDGKALLEQDGERWKAVPLSKPKGDK